MTSFDELKEVFRILLGFANSHQKCFRMYLENEGLSPDLLDEYFDETKEV